MRHLSLLLILLLSGTASAQRFVGVVGLDVVDFSGAGANDSTLKPRSMVGAFHRFLLPSAMLDVGLQYVMRRVDWRVCGLSDCSGEPDAVEGHWTFHDFEVPILLRVPLSHQRLRVVALAGVSPWFTLRSREEVEGSGGSELPYITTWDVALVGGAGVDRQVGVIRYGVELRGSIGTTGRHIGEDDVTYGTAYAGYLLLSVTHDP